MKTGIGVLLLVSGCSRASSMTQTHPIVRVHVTPVSDAAPYGPSACLEKGRKFSDAELALGSDPGSPIPGDDSLRTVVGIDDRSVLVDVVAFQVVRLDETVVYSSSHPSFAPISLRESEGPYTVRVLVKVTTRGGLYEHLSSCHERIALIPEGEHSTLIIEDSPSLAPVSAALVRFEGGE